MNLHPVISHIKSNIGHMQEVIGEILLDDITLITATNHKIVNSMCGIYFHDVPENRLTTNLDHWLRLKVGLFGNTGSKTSSENNGFHM